MSTSISFVLLFGISGGEILVILLLVLVLFGPKKIPEIARTIGKGMNEIKKVQRDINAEINRYSREIENPAKQITEDIEGFKKGLNEQIADTLDESKPAASSVESATGAPSVDVSPASEITKANNDELPYPYNDAGINDPVESTNKEDDKDSKDKESNK